MIVVDTSALMAILQDEPKAQACMATIDQADALLMSAGTVAEALIVAARRGLESEMEELLAGLGLEITQVNATVAYQVANAYRRWGKGKHPAKLNYGDCFAYALAHERNCPLLYIGQDFAQTDVQSAL